MDETLIAFREAAGQENAHRRQRRRYSPSLQRQAMAYWEERRAQEGVRAIAAALGISVSTLQRWTRAASEPRFRPIKVVAAATPVESAPIVVMITTAGPRVEGLTVESAARLLVLLR
jgi:hypothetical protein